MRKLLCMAILAMGLLNARGAVGIPVVNTFPTANWSANSLVNLHSKYGLESNPDDLFPNPDFDLIFELDDQTIQTAAPFGAIIVDSAWVNIGTNYVGYNTVIDSTLTYTVIITNYISLDVFVNNAQAGNNNYLPFIMSDANSQLHYGWLQYELQPFTDNAVGINFIAGAINAVPNQLIVAGVVPEPSTWALLGAGFLVLGIFGKRKMASRLVR